MFTNKSVCIYLVMRPHKKEGARSVVKRDLLTAVFLSVTHPENTRLQLALIWLAQVAGASFNPISPRSKCFFFS